MAKIEFLGTPILIEGLTCDPGGLIMSPSVDGDNKYLQLKLNNEQSILFIEFCQKYNKKLIEDDGQLQSLFDIDNVSYITSIIPLLTFRQEFYPNLCYSANELD